jgi:hypothetical protein
MKTLIKYLLLGVMVFALVPSLAWSDTPLTLGVWAGPYDEAIGAPGTYFAETWSYTGSAVLSVTDIYVVGDAFDVFDNGVSIMVLNPVDGSFQNIPGCDGNAFDASCHYTTDPNVALADPYFAHGSVLLGGGLNEITIEATELPTGFTDSTVALKVDAVPEPASVVLFGTLLLGLGGLVRRRMAR